VKSDIKSLSKLRVDRSQDTIHSKTVNVLRAAILEGSFRPGERLVERVLCETTGVGRSSIREALRQLEAEHLIEYTPHKGPFVVSITVEDLQEIYEMREAVEGLAVRLFTERASDDVVAQLPQIVDRYDEAMRHQEIETILKITDEFFSVLFDGAENKLVSYYSNILHAKIRFVRMTTTYRQTDAQKNKYIQTFRDIANAIQSRDVDLAVAASRRHVQHAASVAISAFQKQD